VAGALDGILVVALEQAVAAPFCTARLADAGARVIKIERAEGDFARGYDSVVHGESAYFAWLNRGKESLVLDIKQPDDMALLHKLLARTDVFVQNLAPGAAERAGLGGATLRAHHPRLITVDISGYGEDGPYRDMKAYDLLIQCESGVASVTGSPDAPGRVGVSVADITCGMNAHAGIMQALFEREKTGRGQGIAVSLFAGMAEWMAVPLLHYDYGQRVTKRVGLNHPSIAPYGIYATGDGRQIVIAIQNEREWQRLCEGVLGDGKIATDSRFASNVLRVQNRGELDQVLNTILGTLTGDDFIARLKNADIAFGAVNSVAELSKHPQLRRIEVASPTGPISLPAPPTRLNNGVRQPGAVPAIGQHTAAIRAEFGK